MDWLIYNNKSQLCSHVLGFHSVMFILRQWSLSCYYTAVVFAQAFCGQSLLTFIKQLWFLANLDKKKGLKEKHGPCSDHDKSQYLFTRQTSWVKRGKHNKTEESWWKNVADLIQRRGRSLLNVFMTESCAAALSDITTKKQLLQVVCDLGWVTQVP